MTAVAILTIPMEPARILYEDERLIAVLKPAGRLVIPGRGSPSGQTLREEAERYLGKKVFIVHRLDREASGIVLFAKDPEAHRDLCLQFEKRQVKKGYLAMVQGGMEGEGMIEEPIRAFGSGRMGVDQKGKPSRTRYKVLKQFSDSTLLEVQPETGRRHQIRVHLYSIGHPIFGDTLYGKVRPVGGAPRLMLHALELSFSSLDGRPLKIRCDPPEDFLDVLRKA